MADGSFQNYVNNTLGLYCEYSWSQSISGNYSDVTVSVWAKYYSLDINSRSGGSVTVDGSSAGFSTEAISNYPSGGGGVTKLTQQTIRVYHNSDGTKTGVGISVYWPVQVTYAGTYYGSLSASTTINLPTIPRASTMSIDGGTIGEKVVLHISAASDSFRHRVLYSFGSVNGDWALNDVTGGWYAWYPPESLANQIPNSMSGNGTLILQTYSNGYLIGTNYYNMTLSVSSSVVPSVGTITISPASINNKNILVQNKNRVSVSVSGCSAGTGSSIKSYTFSGPGISTTTTSTSVSGGPISNIGTLTYKVTVTDSRGRTASKYETITCYAYSAPYFTSFNAYRANSEGKADNNGSYIQCTYETFYEPVNGTNSVTVKISGGPSSVTGKEGSALINLNGDITSTYKIYGTVSDSYKGESNSITVNVFGASRVMNVLQTGDGVAFGKMAEDSNLLDVKWKIKTNGDYVATEPVELYYSASGTSGTITLSQSTELFQYLEIFYKDDTRDQNQSIRVWSPNGEYVTLSCIEPNPSTSESIMYLRSCGWTISGGSMIPGHNGFNYPAGVFVEINKNSSGTISIKSMSSGDSYIRIVRVLGYK